MICRVCDNDGLDLAVDLGMQPWCNNFLKPEQVGKEPYYPLRVVRCRRCGTAQLDYTVPKEIMFGDHTYLSGTTRSLGEHFRKIAEEADDRFFKGVPGRSVLDIGSNDGTQLKCFQRLGYEVLGVESSKGTAKMAVQAGVPTVNEFFNLGQARKLGRKFHLINASGVFFHLEELHSVTDGIKEALREDGVFIVQFLYMKSIMENLAFDQIYHEHLLYYNLNTIEVLLERHGLEMFDAYLAPIHGGEMIGFVAHKGRRQSSERLQSMRRAEEARGSNTLKAFEDFSARIKKAKEDNMSYLRLAKTAGKKVWGFGAPVKGNTMLNYFGAGPDLIECLVEKNALRRGLFSPGMHIPVLIEDELEGAPDIYYVFAWNFKDEILANNKALIEKGVEFYFPVNPGGTK